VSNVEALLDRLNGVKSSGQGRWLARCPAHEDRSPSLSIRDMGDGRILLKCFAECDTEAVLQAMGLQFSDLFPERLPDLGYHRRKTVLSARETLDVIDHELTVAALILADVADKKEIDSATWSRFALASSRIGRVRDHGR
jgi:hypothetical protein